MPTVLIAFPGGAGVVQLDSGEIHLTHDVSDGGSLLSGRGHSPTQAWLDDDRSLVGGLIPPGAVSVEVVDDRGVRVDATVRSGVYAAIIDQPDDGQEPVACCRDAAGSVVRRPLSGEYACTPVGDATEPCPACGAIAYDECVPTERWRAGRPSADGTTAIPSPIVVCRICGHGEREGAIMRLTSPDGEDEAARAEQIARARAARRVRRWHECKLALQAITFPIYAAEERPAYISSLNRHGDKVTGLTIAHTNGEAAEPLDGPAQIEIATSTRTPRLSDIVLARLALEHWVHHGIDHPRSTEQCGSTDRSNAASTLSLRAVARRRRAAVLTAARSETHIAVDGTPERFWTLTTPNGCWVGIRRHGDLTITIAACDVDSATIRLQPVPDPASHLLGPEPD